MKKIFALTVSIVLLACGSSFAIDSLADQTPTAGGGYSIYGGVNGTDATSSSAVLLGKMSKGVYFVGNVDTAAPEGEGYAIATKHLSGSKIYGTAHDSTAIYFRDVGDTALAGTDVSAESNTAFTSSNWTAM